MGERKKTHPVEFLSTDGSVAVGIEEPENGLQLLAVRVHGVEHGLAVCEVLCTSREFHVELRHECTTVTSDSRGGRADRWAQC